MRSPDAFDAFYKETRDRLLLQTYALTGDLPAAQRAVRDAYVGAWHHWRKVGSLGDPESWVRPLAWSHAQMRHTTRVWHRDKSLSKDNAATLSALSKLSGTQRKVLLLNHLASVSMADLAREVATPREQVEQELQRATASYSRHRDRASTGIQADLLALGGVTRKERFPRASIVRRAGTTRRRGFTTAAAAVTVAALLGGGYLVGDRTGVSPSLDKEKVATQPLPSSPAAAPATIDQAGLVTAEQATRLAPRSTWEIESTDENTQGTGIYTPCQGQRFADPKGQATLVRKLTGRLGPRTQKADLVTAVQATELSDDAAHAKDAFASAVGWYSACAVGNTQLLGTYELPGVGDQANVFVLRTWGREPATITVGVARTKLLTTTTLRRVPGAAAGTSQADAEPVASLLAAAVNRLCGTPGAGTCAAPPRLQPVPPLPIAAATGMLDPVDLPQPGAVKAPWTATNATKAGVNVAAISCDNSDFSKAPVAGGLSRTFLVLKGVPESFGITESAGRLPGPKRAHGFVERVRGRMASCEDRELGSTVVPLGGPSTKRLEISAWQVRAEVNDAASVSFLMAIVRNGSAVAQVGFVVAPWAGYTTGQFMALARRTAERLDYLEAPTQR